MLRRPPPPDPRVGERFVALFGGTGWVPEPFVAPVGTPEPLADPVPEASWTPRSRAEPAPSVVGSLRSAVLDPGRRGALALVAVAVVAALVAGVVLLRGRPSTEPAGSSTVVATGAGASDSGAQVVVDVAGKVRHPGLVHLRAGSRVDDALRAAGGLLPGATTGGLNLAQKVVDGTQVVVGAVAAAPGGASAGGALDLNAATASDLDGLPGIGPVLAQRIVDYRTEHGPFGSVDQLRQVSGIGESKYQTLKAKVRV